MASARTYGARRIWRDVLEAGFSCGLHKIERLMRAQALRRVLTRSYRERPHAFCRDESADKQMLKSVREARRRHRGGVLLKIGSHLLNSLGRRSNNCLA